MTREEAKNILARVVGGATHPSYTDIREACRYALDVLNGPSLPSDVDEAAEGETRIVYAKADLDPHGVDYGIRYLHLRLPDDTPVGTRYIVHIKPKKGLK